MMMQLAGQTASQSLQAMQPSSPLLAAKPRAGRGALIRVVHRHLGLEHVAQREREAGHDLGQQEGTGDAVQTAHGRGSSTGNDESPTKVRDGPKAAPPFVYRRCSVATARAASAAVVILPAPPGCLGVSFRIAIPAAAFMVRPFPAAARRFGMTFRIAKPATAPATAAVAIVVIVVTAARAAATAPTASAAIVVVFRTLASGARMAFRIAEPAATPATAPTAIVVVIVVPRATASTTASTAIVVVIVVAAARAA
jgi:hypothetical protein